MSFAAVLWRVRERVLCVWASEGDFSTQESMTSSVCVFMVGVNLIKMNWEKETDGKMISLGVFISTDVPIVSLALLKSSSAARRERGAAGRWRRSLSACVWPIWSLFGSLPKQYKITLNWEMIRFLTKAHMDESQRLRNDELPVDIWKQLWRFYSKRVCRHSGVIWF